MQPKPLTLPVYMDCNATTPLDPRVRDAMWPFLNAQFGNAASMSHAYGWQAASAVKKAREQVGALVGCRANDVLWTSGATESNNLAIFGVARGFCKQNPHIITQATEHKAVLEVCEAATEWGAEVSVLPVDTCGRISLSDLEKAIRPTTVLISIMMANNEIGTLQPIAEIGELCRERKIIFHTDAAQSVGKYEFSMHSMHIDLLSISGHKLYGPKGIGALIIRPHNRDFELKPILFGGDQERRLRPGTLNVPGIVGLGEACAAARETMLDECCRLTEFQQKILSKVRAIAPWVKLNGPEAGRLCNNLSFSFSRVDADDLPLELSGLAYSSGSACNTGSAKPSHVLKALGLEDKLARSTLRLGMGRFTTAAEVQITLDKLLKMLAKHGE